LPPRLRGCRKPAKNTKKLVYFSGYYYKILLLQLQRRFLKNLLLCETVKKLNLYMNLEEV
jgi:hypothetical protein